MRSNVRALSRCACASPAAGRSRWPVRSRTWSGSADSHPAGASSATTAPAIRTSTTSPDGRVAFRSRATVAGSGGRVPGTAPPTKASGSGTRESRTRLSDAVGPRDRTSPLNTTTIGSARFGRVTPPLPGGPSGPARVRTGRIERPEGGRMTDVLELVVAGRGVAADDVALLDLAMPDGSPLPEWAAGAHVDVLLPGGLGERQYSL